MKSINIIGVTTFAALALSGCGGSGGDNSLDNDSAANSPPEISGSPDVAVRAGTEYSFKPVAVDADGDALHFSIRNHPDWLSIDPLSGEVSGIPADTEAGVYDEILIDVSDGEADDTLEPFDLTVLVAKLTQDNISTEGSLTPAPATAVQLSLRVRR